MRCICILLLLRLCCCEQTNKCETLIKLCWDRVKWWMFTWHVFIYVCRKIKCWCHCHIGFMDRTFEWRAGAIPSNLNSSRCYYVLLILNFYHFQVGILTMYCSTHSAPKYFFVWFQSFDIFLRRCKFVLGVFKICSTQQIYTIHNFSV